MRGEMKLKNQLTYNFMKTAREILNNYHETSIDGAEYDVYDREEVIKAMEEYAEENSKYWKSEFLKIVDHWYNNEKQNMDKVEFILTKERRFH